MSSSRRPGHYPPVRAMRVRCACSCCEPWWALQASFFGAWPRPSWWVVTPSGSPWQPACCRASWQLPWPSPLFRQLALRPSPAVWACLLQQTSQRQPLRLVALRTKPGRFQPAARWRSALHLAGRLADDTVASTAAVSDGADQRSINSASRMPITATATPASPMRAVLPLCAGWDAAAWTDGVRCAHDRRRFA